MFREDVRVPSTAKSCLGESVSVCSVPLAEFELDSFVLRYLCTIYSIVWRERLLGLAVPKSIACVLRAGCIGVFA